MEGKSGSGSRRVMYTRASHTALTNFHLTKMRLNDELCDVTIKTNKKEFRAHKVILAIGIKYFHTMFLSGFRESTQNIVQITAVNEANMEALISFAYTGKITLTNNNVLSLLEDVDYLDVDDVKEACIGFLRTNLMAENALKAYRLANAINCASLKEICVQTMMANFDNYSHTKEYLDIEFDVLKDILSVDNTHSVETQSFFEGIVRWLVCDVPQRGAYLTDLLRMIKMADLTVDYLMAYLYENIDPEHDAIIRTIVEFYRIRIKRQPIVANNSNSKLRLMVINRRMLSHVQYFDFDKNEWTLCYTNVHHLQYAESVVSQNKLYIVGGRNDVRCVSSITVFDPENGVSSSPPTNCFPRRDCAVCASGKHLYICGGKNNVGSDLNLVERYDVTSNICEKITPLNTARSNAVAVAFKGNIYVIGGNRKGLVLGSVERYSPGDKQWTIIDSLHYPRASLAVAILNDKLYVCGESSLEVFVANTNKWQKLASMQKKRHSFLMVAFDGKLLAVGGDSTQSGPTVETYNPNTNEWTLNHSPGFHIKYLMGGLIRA